jgi:hypothetical protein
VNLQLFISQTAGLITDEKPSYQALKRLLAISQYTQRATTLQVMLCEALGVQKQTDWPLAPLSWLGEGGQPDTAYWLNVDPVYFMLQRDYFSLGELVVLPQANAQSLVDSLNQHFASDGLQFHLGQPDFQGHGRWYLRLNTSPDIKTTLPEMAMGRDIRPFLPQGAEAGKWNRLLNEIQMLLHVHPVNQAREAKGEPPVNSLWLSGGGALTTTLVTRPGTLIGNNPLVRGLCLQADSHCLDLPENAQKLFENILINKQKEDILIVIDEVYNIEDNWLKPLLASLRARKTKQLTLHFSALDQVHSFNIRPIDLLKFWRKSRSLKEYF